MPRGWFDDTKVMPGTPYSYWSSTFLMLTYPLLLYIPGCYAN